MKISASWIPYWTWFLEVYAFTAHVCLCGVRRGMVWVRRTPICQTKRACCSLAIIFDRAVCCAVLSRILVHVGTKYRHMHLIVQFMIGDNLVYACQPCNAVKGGLWPTRNDEADSYIDPCCAPENGDSPETVFEYDLDNGEIKVRHEVFGVTKANAEQTIADLALNYHRDHQESVALNAGIRRVDLAVLRHQWITALNQALDRLAPIMPNLLPALVAGMVSPNARFSSICRQTVEQSEYRRYLV